MAQSFFDLLNCCGALLFIGIIEEVEMKEFINFNVSQ
jgi:hypothetical protein